MSSYSQTMRSRNQNFPHKTRQVPSSTLQRFNTTNPQTRKGSPNAEMLLRTLGALRWWRGTGISSRLSHTRSPRTAFDAQLSVEAGFSNRRGLNHIQNRDNATGTIAHHPSHTRLQIAATSKGRTVVRVQTLQGLACRCHTVSLMLKVWAIRCSRFMVADGSR